MEGRVREGGKVRIANSEINSSENNDNVCFCTCESCMRNRATSTDLSECRVKKNTWPTYVFVVVS